MKRILIPFPLILVGLMLAGCTPSAPRTETYMMSLGNVQDSTNVLEVPSTVNASDAITIRVSVAGGGCDVFSKFESKRSNDTLELTPIGSRQLDVACTAIYSTKWEAFSDAAIPVRSNPFKVIVHRANGTDLERSVSITP
jgi:hypothetical protein